MTLVELLKRKKAKIAILPEKNDFIFTEEGKKMRETLGRIEVESLHKKIESEPSKFIDFDKIESLSGYTITLIAHDYSALTPKMWNTAYEQLGMNVRSIMVIADPKDAKEILNDLKLDPKYLGGGAGVGFKDSILPYLDRLNPEDIGSSNIIVNQAKMLTGYNTDAEGLMRSIKDRSSELGIIIKHAVVVGAGGVAKQFTRQLAENNIKQISIINRTVEKAKKLADSLNERYGEGIAHAYGEDEIEAVVRKSMPDMFVNTSDKGGDSLPDHTMFGSGSIEDAKRIIRTLKAGNPKMLYVDILLTKSGTESRSFQLLRSEGIEGKYLLDGKPMMMYQAVPAYKLVEFAYPDLHKKINDKELLALFRKAVE